MLVLLLHISHSGKKSELIKITGSLKLDREFLRYSRISHIAITSIKHNNNVLIFNLPVLHFILSGT